MVVVVVALLPVLGAGTAHAAGDDTVETFGTASFLGSTDDLLLNAPVTDLAGAPGGDGYWILALDGGVFSFGKAEFYGSMGDTPLNAAVLGIEVTPSGEGYWLFAGDGGIFSFGDADFHGSTGDLTLNSPVVDMIATPDGSGYWLVSADGGVFSFGSAPFAGSAGDLALDAPVVAAAATPDGMGYWLASASGGVFTYGSAVFLGSAAGLGDAPVVDIATTIAGDGYWLSAQDGTVYEFGAALHHGDLAATLAAERRVVAMESPASTGYRLLATEGEGLVPLLGPGDSGASVEALQQHLVSMGYWLGAVDGGYGLLTSQAVTAFQKIHGLARTGRVDFATQTALLRATRPHPASTSGYVIEVDKARQVVFVARDGHTEWILNTSTGTERPYVYEGQTYLADTPPGRWTVTWQVDGIRDGNLGRLFRPKYFHQDGIAFHGYPSVPSYPASHGCVRFTNAAINWIWDANIIPLGTAVWVY